MGRRVLKFDGLSGRGLWWRLAPQFIVSVTGLASRLTGQSERSEESWYAAHMRQSAVNAGQREGCRLAVRSALRIISTCHVVHPLPLRGIPPDGKHVTGFSGRFAPLQIQFLCHLKGTQDVTGLASCPTGHSGRSEESWYAEHMRQWALNTDRREAAAFGGSPYPASRDFSTGKRLT